MKFQDPLLTAKGDIRAFVDLTSLQTLWFNTGTKCNLECRNCYIESSPVNSRLSFLSASDVKPYLEEIKKFNLGTKNINFTGGEPFINPNIIGILDLCLSAGHEVLVLTNAYNILKRHEKNLNGLHEKYGEKLKLRISLDHYTKAVHEKERGEGTFTKTLEQIKKLYNDGHNISIAGRSLLNEKDSGYDYQQLLINHGINIDINEKLVIFPEMDSDRDVPEITTKCWGILNKKSTDQMCATERMIVKRAGDDRPIVMPCTLLAYDEQFNLGKTLNDSNTRVQLNHRFCAEFCILGGASCSSVQ